MIRIRTLLAICVFALPIPAAVAGCGGDDASDEDPQAILEETFDNDETISSGDLAVTASVTTEGREDGSFEATLGGPFQGDPDDPTAVPQLDWDFLLSGSGFGEDEIDLEGGFVLTEDNAFIEYQGDTYAVGRKRFSELRGLLETQAGSTNTEDATSFSELCAQQLEAAGADPAACEIDIASWFTNLTNEGIEEVGGEDAVHVHGDADVQQILSDVGELFAALLGPLAGAFDPAQFGVLSGVVEEAAIDVYSGEEDRLLRGLDATISINLAALGAAIDIPFETADGELSVEIADVDAEQTIAPPEGPTRPIDELPGFDLGPFGLALPGVGDIDEIAPEGGGAGGGGGLGKAGGRALEQQDCIAQAADPDEIIDCLNS